MKYLVTILFIVLSPFILLAEDLLLTPLLEQKEIQTGPRTDITIPNIFYWRPLQDIVGAPGSWYKTGDTSLQLIVKK